MMIMGLLYAVWGFMFLSVLGLLSGRLGDRLAGRPKWPEKMSWVGGAVMIALGLRLALTRPG
jgi:threonine/homoserine/homoserine lactone efflux protein